MLLQDISRDFSDCYSWSTKHNMVVYLQGASSPRRVGLDAELDELSDKDVSYSAVLVGVDKAVKLMPSELAFLHCPTDWGWFNVEGHTVFLSINSRRQWRKGLTRHRLTAKQAVLTSSGRIVFNNDRGLVHARMSSVVENLITGKGYPELEEVRSLFNDVRRVKSVALSRNIMMMGKKGCNSGLVFHQDVPVARYDIEGGVLYLPEKAENYREVLEDYFPHVEGGQK